MALSVIGLWPLSCCAAESHFALPAETLIDSAGLNALKASLAQGAYADAAGQLEPLLAEDADKLMTTGDRGLISVAAWVDTLPARQRAALTAAYREKYDAAARAQLDALRQAPGARPEEFYNLARARRFSTAGATGYALAADRMMEGGDFSAASGLYQLALRGGWVPDDRRAAQIELLRRLDDGKALAPPPDADSRVQPATRSSIPGAAPGRLTPYAGSLPFDAPWLVDPAASAGLPRFFPFAAGDRTFLAGPRMIVAFRLSGPVAWSMPAIAAGPTALAAHPPAPRRPVEQVQGARQPPNYSVAALTDVYGRAQIIVVRQPSAGANDADTDFCLRAVRAGDGKLLWSSESQPLLKDVSFASTPAVCGRFTYAVALAIQSPAAAGPAAAGDQQAALLLMALDTLSGELRWQTTLGRFTLRVQERSEWGAQSPWDGVWEQSEPLVVGDTVYITPNAGFAAAVGRFDGKLRWLRPHRAANASELPRAPRTRDELRRLAQGRTGASTTPRAATIDRAAESSPVSPDPALGLRWRGTPVLCGTVLIAAPQGTFSVHALDAATGRRIWSVAGAADVPTLIGKTATTAIFAGPAAIIALEARTGETSWRWDPPKGTRITGPAVVKDDAVLVPSTPGIITLRSDDGAIAREPGNVPVLRRLLNGESIKRTVENAGAASAFGLQD